MLEDAGITQKKVKKQENATIRVPVGDAISSVPGGASVIVHEAEMLESQFVEMIALRMDPQTREAMNPNTNKGFRVDYGHRSLIKLDSKGWAMLDAFVKENPELLKSAQVLFKFVNSWGRPLVNEVWQRVHGYTLANRNDYYPRRRDYLWSDKNPEDELSFWRNVDTEHWGSTKKRAPSSRAFVIGSGYRTVHGYVEHVSALYGKQEAALRAIRFLNDPKFRHEVDARVYKGSEKISQAMKNVVDYTGLEPNKKGKVDSIVRFLLRKFHVGALAGKAHIVLYQTTSITNAAQVIPVKYLLRIQNVKLPSKKNLKALSDRSPVFLDRIRASGHQLLSPGTYGTSELQWLYGGELTVGEAFMVPIKKADQTAILTIFEAAKAWAKDEGLKGEEALDWAARKTEQAIYETQPTWDATTLSGLSLEGRKSALAAIMTLFSSQRSKNANMLMANYYELRHTGFRGEKEWKSFLKTCFIITDQSAMINAISLHAMKFFYGDPEDEIILRDYVLGTAFKALSSWVFVGSLIVKTYQNIEAQREGKTYSKKSLDPITDTFASATKALLEAMTLIDQIQTDEVYGKGSVRAGEPKYKDTSVRLLDNVFRVLTVFGFPTSITWSQIKKYTKGLKPLRENSTYYSELWNALERNDEARARKALRGLKKNEVTFYKIRKLAWDRNKASKKKIDLNQLAEVYKDGEKK